MTQDSEELRVEQVGVTDADMAWAREIVSGVFLTTRFNCAAAIEDARDLVKHSGYLKDHPDMLQSIDGLLEGATVKVCEVLLEQRQIDDVAKQMARHRLQSQTVVAGDGEIDRPAILVAAQAWWARNMNGKHYRAALIKGDGRVDVHWNDGEESGRYTLPVDFMNTPPSPHPIAPASEDTAGAVERARALCERSADRASHLLEQNNRTWQPTRAHYEGLRNAFRNAASELAALPASEHGRDREAHVFLDCDGVLADFDKAGELLWGMPPRQYEAKVGAKQFWHELENTTDFYGTLPLMPDAMKLFEGVKHLHPTILTGCPRGNWAQAQKVAWAAKHFPGVPIITCRSADKRDFAKPGDVLIDDWPQHRHRWIEMGGVFIVHHDAESSLAALWAHYPALQPQSGEAGA